MKFKKHILSSFLVLLVVGLYLPAAVFLPRSSRAMPVHREHLRIRK
jgi:hypothetical protein